MDSTTYRYVDIDNHLWEADDCFTRHIESKYADRAVRVVRDSDGRGTFYVVDEPLWFSSEARTAADGAGPPIPGSMQGLQSGHLDDYVAIGDASMEVMRATRPTRGDNAEPGVDRAAHLAGMDARDTEATVLFASKLNVERHLVARQPPDVVYANLRSFNRWLDDAWGLDYEGRIFAAPVISLIDTPLAVAELERVLAAGARCICLWPGKLADGRSPADPSLDPFWARVDEARIPVAYHLSDSGAQDEFRMEQPEEPHTMAWRMSPLQWYVNVDRPIMDTLAMLVLHNLFGRFPNVNVLSVENGCAWVPYLLHRLDIAATIARTGPWLGGRLDGKPSDVFRRSVLVTPYLEEDLSLLEGVIGPETFVLGTDFPHAECAGSGEFRVKLEASYGPVAARRIMRDTASELLAKG